MQVRILSRFSAVLLLAVVAVLSGSMASAQLPPEEHIVYVTRESGPEGQLSSQVLVRLASGAGIDRVSLTVSYDAEILQPVDVSFPTGWDQEGEWSVTDNGLELNASRGTSCGPGGMCAVATIDWEPLATGASNVEVVRAELTDGGNALTGVSTRGAVLDAQLSTDGQASPPPASSPENSSSSSPPTYELAAVVLAVVAGAFVVVLGSLGVVSLARRATNSGNHAQPSPGKALVQGEFTDRVTAYLEEMESLAAAAESPGSLQTPIRPAEQQEPE